MTADRDQHFYREVAAPDVPSPLRWRAARMWAAVAEHLSIQPALRWFRADLTPQVSAAEARVTEALNRTRAAVGVPPLPMPTTFSHVHSALHSPWGLTWSPREVWISVDVPGDHVCAVVAHEMRHADQLRRLPPPRTDDQIALLERDAAIYERIAGDLLARRIRRARPNEPVHLEVVWSGAMKDVSLLADEGLRRGSSLSDAVAHNGENRYQFMVANGAPSMKQRRRAPPVPATQGA